MTSTNQPDKGPDMTSTNQPAEKVENMIIVRESPGERVLRPLMIDEEILHRALRVQVVDEMIRLGNEPLRRPKTAGQDKS